MKHFAALLFVAFLHFNFNLLAQNPDGGAAYLPEAQTKQIKKIAKGITYCLIDQAGKKKVLQVGLPGNAKIQHGLAARVCKQLPSLGMKKITTVVVEDGITALGECNCRTGKQGFTVANDRQLGYYYFATN
jgi:hypothetical protein